MTDWLKIAYVKPLTLVVHCNNLRSQIEWDKRKYRCPLFIFSVFIFCPQLTVVKRKHLLIGCRLMARCSRTHIYTSRPPAVFLSSCENVRDLVLNRQFTPQSINQSINTILRHVQRLRAKWAESKYEREWKKKYLNNNNNKNYIVRLYSLPRLRIFSNFVRYCSSTRLLQSLVGKQDDDWYICPLTIAR